MSSLLNKSQTKKFIIAKFRSIRPGMPIERISQSAIENLEAQLRAIIVFEVKRHPSIGKTFMMPKIDTAK